MALPDPLALKDNAAVARTFTRRLPIPNGNRYVDTSSTSTRTNACEVRSLYTASKPGKDAFNRNIASFSIARVDVDEQVHTAVLSLSLSRPVGSDITDTDISDLYAYMQEFLAAAAGDYKTRFNRGEV